MSLTSTPDAEQALAAACARGDAPALAILERDYLARLEPVLARRGLDPAQVAEVIQRLRIALLAGDAPRIAAFAGRGSLLGWLRVAAVRTALNLRRETWRETELPDDRAARLAAESDVELEHLRRRFHGVFRDAFAAALARLTRRQRNLLRQHYLDGLRIHELAAAYAVHRVTASQWLHDAKDALVEAIRAALAERLGATAAELPALVRGVTSRLDVSLGSLLRTPSAIAGTAP